jgi:hypothetical protein
LESNKWSQSAEPNFLHLVQNVIHGWPKRRIRMPATVDELPNIIGHLYPMVRRPTRTLAADVSKALGVIIIVIHDVSLASIDLTKQRW